MHPEFWHLRWRMGQIGFHQDRVNPHLETWWPSLGLARGTRVLVPLCGKSHDLLWLRDQGHEVMGVELSEVACEAFFAEQGLTPTVGPFGPFTAWRVPGLVLLQGDVFDLPPDILADAVYDRAATIALPAAMRDAYAQLIARATRSGAPGLLVTLEYPQHERSGPPFSVPLQEVRRLYGAAFELEPLFTSTAEQTDAEREAWGLSSLTHRVTRLLRR